MIAEPMLSSIYAALKTLAGRRPLDLADHDKPVACSDCFIDPGLRYNAQQSGADIAGACPHCKSEIGRKLSSRALAEVAHQFFVWGSLQRFEYGAAPTIQFNDLRDTEIVFPPWLRDDVKTLERILGIGFFYYGPRLWMLGEIEPLTALQDPSTRGGILSRIVSEYPETRLSRTDSFYRVRKAPAEPSNVQEYDSPPISMGAGRLESVELPVMYASQNLDICVHESRFTAEDILYVATLEPTRDLKLLDLSAHIPEPDDLSEFESLDLAIHTLFLAGSHSYAITRDLAVAVKRADYDGIVYPSYFSLLHTGFMPFETMLGISFRKISAFRDYEKSKIVTNLAIFGRPVEQRLVAVKYINRLIIRNVSYKLLFGPIDFDQTKSARD